MIRICRFMNWSWQDLMTAPEWVPEIIEEVAKEDADAREAAKRGFTP